MLDDVIIDSMRIEMFRNALQRTKLIISINSFLVYKQIWFLDNYDTLYR